MSLVCVKMNPEGKHILYEWFGTKTWRFDTDNDRCKRQLRNDVLPLSRSQSRLRTVSSAPRKADGTLGRSVIEVVIPKILRRPHRAEATNLSAILKEELTLQ